jgi:putative transcriptional regulator
MKRNLFAELKEGMAELAAEREGKLTLRKVEVEVPEVLDISPDEIRTVREALHASQAVMARRLQSAYLSELGAGKGKAKCSGGGSHQAGREASRDTQLARRAVISASA